MEPFESEHPTISIVSAVGRDSAKSDALELRRQIDSVLSQEYPNFEHIVIDGASQDATRDVLRSHPHVLWTSEPHLSLAGQWNAGFERSTGEIVVFVEGEDVFPPAVFSEVYRLLKESHWVMGGKSFRNPSDADEECSSNLFRSYFDVLKYWVFRATPDFSSMFFRRDFLTSLVEGSLFSESYALSAEYELAMRIFRWCEDHRESLPAISSSPLSSGKPALEVNKAKYLEASRVFHREGYRGCGAERRVSIIIATDGVTPAFEKTLQSCSKQSLADLEIITWGVNASPTACVELDRFVRDIALIANDGRYRAVLPSGPEPHSYF
ncbi:MAG: glycosyltransferase, partial [Bdellovibrionales bacterium]|nr:glycosyltransferase [Bdellovibrionales bacterium]